METWEIQPGPSARTNSISLAGNTKDVSYIFTPASNIKPGQYILMLGADVSPVTIMKAVKVNLV